MCMWVCPGHLNRAMGTQRGLLSTKGQVQRKNTHCDIAVDRVCLEDALGDFGEDEGHGVVVVVVEVLHGAEHLHSVVEELAAEELVDDEDLSQHVEHVDNLQQEELEGVVPVPGGVSLQLREETDQSARGEW